MSLSAPSPPNPQATAAAQEQVNQQAATQQAEINDVNQVTPYGDLTYQQTGTSSDGTPQFTATTQLSPQEQDLFNTTVQTQQGAANSANNLIKNLGTELSSAPNLGNDDLINTMMGWQQKYMSPIFAQQQSNLNSQLAAQGITQGSDAYNNAQNLQARNVDNAYESALASDEGQAYNQAAESYQLPIQTLATLLGEGSPASANSGLVQTPQEQIQPANEEGLVQQDYQSELNNYGNTMSGLFSIPSAVLGGWARAGGLSALSDRRAKKDIARVGSLNDGTPVYRYRLKNDPAGAMQIGLMAQDIADDMPDAIGIGDDGFLHVDYERATRRSLEAA
jgi:hypothetical protein